MRKNGKLNKKFNLILEEYSKDYGFLNFLMNDMSRYLSLICKINEDKKNNDNNKYIEVSNYEEKKIYEGLFDNKINI